MRRYELDLHLWGIGHDADLRQVIRTMRQQNESRLTSWSQASLSWKSGAEGESSSIN